MKKITIFILFFTFGCSRKELIEEILIKENESKLVIYSLITPNKWIYVNLRQTLPIGLPNNSNISAYKDSTYDIVSGARVEIKNLLTNHKIILPEIEKGVYGVSPNDFKITAGESYALSTIYHNQNVYAECTIPQNQATIQKIEVSPLKKAYDTTINNNKIYFSYSTAEITYSGKDISDFNHNYKYLGYNERITTKRDGQITKESSTGLTLSKKNADYYILKGSISLNKDDISQTVEMQVLTAYPILYDFFENTNLLVSQKTTIQHNPFRAFRGVTPLITNIKNGYGVFAGYLISPKQQITVNL